VVVNKSDQAQVCDLDPLSRFPCRVAVSAKHNLGLTELREVIVEHLGGDLSLSGAEGVVITERRHRDALLRAITALEGVLSSADLAAPLECLAMDLREALASLGQITGETTPDEILDQIFSRFCIGK
jgi:tRNA modification GTPase